MTTTKTKTNAPERLADLDRRLNEAQAKARQLELDQSAARRRVPELERELAEAITQEKPTTKHDEPLAEARQLRDRPWHDLQSIAAEELRAAQRDRNDFIVKEIEALTASFAPRAHGAVTAVEDALHSVEAAFAEWQAVAAEQTRLLAVVPGLDGQDLPVLPMAFDLLSRELHRAQAAEIPPPLPRSVGPEKAAVPPKTKTQSGGFVPTLVDKHGEVVAQ